MLAKLTWEYLRTRLWEVLAVVVLQTMAAIASLNLPDLNARIIDEGVALGDTDHIWRLGAVMLAVTLGQSVATAVAVFLGSRMAMGLGAWLRHRVFTHTQDFSAQDVHEFGAPSLVTRATNDVQQIQMVVLMTFLIMIQAPIMGVGGVVMALRQDSHLSLLLVVVVPVLALVVGLIMGRLAPLFQVQQTRIDAMNTVLREELSGIRVIRAFVRQPLIRARYRDANDQLRQVALRIGTLFALIFPAVTVIISLSNIGVLWYGGHSIENGESQIGALFAFINYLGLIFMAVMMAAMMFIMVPRANVSAVRIAAVLDHDVSVRSPGRPAPAPEGRWTFALRDVSLRYPGAEDPVLDGVSLEFAPGTTTGVIGSTGSGKTTLVNLIPRLMDPTGGSVTANGVPTTELDPAELRRHIAMVPQRAYLFSGTIASTVSGVPDPDQAQRERVIRALEGAQAMEFVSDLDQGIDTSVEAGGTNFSGGQRQRLTIARALYRSADLFIFDDSFSALDYSTDARLRIALPAYTEGAATLIVAQRVATIRHADRIVVLDDGRIVGRGTHAELMGSCPTYREIVASQMSEEEAA
ncbi:MAG: ABC transporter ATP-binding protein/permease [Actinomyces sp.]|jgi:ATP-binding cassette subfamily B protein|nr:ABC transporter ATP-binding protein [Actinomyces sp.]MCI1642397.1 ABC transporter ATP-binding protein/permease [Actinomyces sp.]MCI1662945.1 ABC transporter ATP-binding protein/permease [Actinomyces sp.]MCI1691539.1 ABC transporter ATP-binding protein/permease [Actinomyces sp.]MCI1787167.1 ABC transporter ATP-binding protein/permease [Actinomyces sp.]MCI1829561.1 ABC transporter ATP-binding protein/permease [Actinomyces sp.]